MAAASADLPRVLKRKHSGESETSVTTKRRNSAAVSNDAQTGAIYSLPDELWDQIISRSDVADTWVERHRHLRNLCLTSKRFCRLAQPMLYHDCYFMRDTPQKTNLCSFIRTIVHRPDLAGEVRSLNVDTTWTEGDAYCNSSHYTRAPCKPFTPEDVRIIRSIVRGLRLTGRARYEILSCPAHQIHKEHYIGFLLTLLPDLRYLGLWLREDHDLSMFERMIEELLPGPLSSGSFFSKLEKISIHYEGDNTWVPNLTLGNCDLPVYFRFPALQDLHVAGRWNTGAIVGWNYPRYMSTVSILQVTGHNILSTADMCKLLDACRALKSFVCASFPPDHSELEDSTFSFPDLYKSLRFHAKSLETLKLWFCDNFELYANSPRIPPLGSLREFERLRTVVLPQHALLGYHPGRQTSDSSPVKVLPLKLETLWIEYCYKATLLPHLEELSSVCSDQFPDLLTLDVGDVLLMSYSSGSRIEEVRENFSEKGVELIVGKCQDDSDDDDSHDFDGESEIDEFGESGPD